MKKIPDVKNNFWKLQEILTLKLETNILIAAIELEVFSELTDWRTPEEVAGKLALHPENTRVLLNCLAASDLIEKTDGRFRNSSLSGEFLVQGSDVYLGDYLLSCHKWYSLSPDDICNLVRTGPEETEKPEIQSEKTWERLARSTVNYQRAGMIQLATGIISSLPEYPSFKKMLDLGSGPGLYGISMVMAHPSMKGVLFDRPDIARFAGSCIEEYGMKTRIEILSGDYMADSIGEDYDLVWASMTLNFAGRELDHIIKKIYDSLAPGGVFVSFSDGETDEGTKPKEMVLSMMMPALQGNDLGLEDGRMADSMIKAGFASVKSRTIMTPVGQMALDIGRKQA